MNYQSVWDNQAMKTHRNEWKLAPFTIGEENDNLFGIRALIGGSQNQLLFVVYLYHHIQVFDLHSYQSIGTYRLPFEFYGPCSFVKIESENHLNINTMMMFYRNYGVLIKYHEKEQTVEYETLPVCVGLQDVSYYSYVSVKDFVVLFGGFKNHGNCNTVDKVYVYSIKTKEWRECLYKLPAASCLTFSIVDNNQKWVHVLGGNRGSLENSQQHLQIRMAYLTGLTLQEIGVIMEYWVRVNRLRMGWIGEFHAIIANYM